MRTATALVMVSLCASGCSMIYDFDEFSFVARADGAMDIELADRDVASELQGVDVIAKSDVSSGADASTVDVSADRREDDRPMPLDAELFDAITDRTTAAEAGVDAGFDAQFDTAGPDVIAADVGRSESGFMCPLTCVVEGHCVAVGCPVAHCIGHTCVPE